MRGLKILWWLLGAGGAGGLTYLLLRSPTESSPEETPVPTPPGNLPPFPHISIGPGLYLRTDAGRAFIALRDAAKLDGIDLPVSTAYRSLAWQTKLHAAWTAYKEGRGPWAPLAAKPDGNGPHQRGLAVDLHGFDKAKSNFNPARNAWMQKNSARFGWYQTGLTFSMKEPWHWYYRGPGLLPSV